MSSDKAITLHTPEVAPMEPLIREIIHPDNIALEHRIREAEALRNTNVLALKLRRLRLTKPAHQYKALSQERSQILEELRKLQASFLELKEQPPSEQNQQAKRALQTQARRARSQLHSLDKRLAPVRPAGMEFQRITQTIEAYQLARQRLQVEQKIAKDLTQETKIYAHYIKQIWSQIPGCHHRWTDAKGKLHIEVPSFTRADTTPDAIYLKVKASYKGMFAWIYGLPYGVRVDDLKDERTLENISVTIQRQVTAIVNENGLWIVINRLSSPDGLLNHVDYSQVMDYYPSHLQNQMPVCVGVGKNRVMQWLLLSQWAHWLIAGWTGGGKSNIANVIVCNLITHHSPQELRVSLIDLKGGVEFDHYKGIPHLLGDIVTEIDEVADLLERIEGEMSKRFELLRKLGVRDIDSYNERVDPQNHMPRLVVFFDEFASITKQGDVSRRIQASVQQLTAKGRAPGVHIMICTQHPSVDIIPGPIKTNLQVRLSGRMPTTSASLTTLGSGDAKELAAIPGRMMLMISPDPAPIQTPHIQENDVRDALKIARQFETPAYQLPEAKQVHQQWTPERIIEFSLKHMGGILAGRPLYEALQDENLSRQQVFALVEQIEGMGCVEFEGKQYQVQRQGRGKRTRYLVETELEPTG